MEQPILLDVGTYDSRLLTAPLLRCGVCDRRYYVQAKVIQLPYVCGSCRSRKLLNVSVTFGAVK